MRKLVHGEKIIEKGIVYERTADGDDVPVHLHGQHWKCRCADLFEEPT